MQPVWFLLFLVVFSGHLLGEQSSPLGKAREMLARTAGISLADPDRMEANRRAFALAAVAAGQTADARTALQLGFTYATADSFADCALAAWPSSSRSDLEGLISDGLGKVPLAVGYQPEEARQSLTKLAWVGGFPGLVKKAETLVLPGSSVALQEDLRRFRSRFHDSLWERLLAFFRKEDGWSELRVQSSADETKAWKEGRLLDGFSSQLLLAEAVRRAAASQSYPARWVVYGLGGLRVGFFNSAPLAAGVLGYRLALLEARAADAEGVLGRIKEFAANTPAVSFTSYGALLDLAKACGANGPAYPEVLAVLESKRRQAAGGLNPYEKMLVYPQLAAAFFALGQPDQATALREEALAILEKDVDPESKGVGLTRLWLSFAVAGDAPGEKFAERMERQSRLVVGGP